MRSEDRSAGELEAWRAFLDDVVLDPDRARAALARDPALLEARGPLGETPLHFLAVEGDEAAVRRLLARGAAVDPENAVGNTPLIEVATLGDMALVTALLDGGADPDRPSRPDRRTSLHAAAEAGHLAVLRLLVARGGDPRARNRYAETPLELCGLSEEELLRAPEREG